MKDFKQFLKQLPNNTIVCGLGEFNPPTTAHELLVKTVKVVSEQKQADHVIFTSPSELISEEKKSNFLSLMFPNAKFKSLGESFFSSAIKDLQHKYKNVVIVAGADQFEEFKSLKEHNRVQVISIGTKDPDADQAKMIQFATKGIYENFKKQLPSVIRDIDGKRLMNEMRIGMGMDPIKEQVVLVKDDLREQYFRGEIFNVGQMVESSGQTYEIVKRGSNHLLLKDASGSLVSKWISDVTQLSEGVIQPNGTDKIETNSPEAAGNVKAKKPKGNVKGFLTFYNYDDKTKNVNEETVEQQKDREEQLKRFQSQTFDPFFSEDSDISDEEIDKMISDLSDDEISEDYEEDEVSIIDEETGEELELSEEENTPEFQAIMEVLSRTERMRAKARLRKTQSKRERTTKVALRKYSDSKTINKRARRLAIKLMKKRLLRGRDPSKVSVGERERIEKMIEKRKAVVNRVAIKLVPRIRSVEKSRMSHKKFTKGKPNVAF